MLPAIRVENLSKEYRLGQISTGTLSRDLERWWAMFRGKEDPFGKIATGRIDEGRSGGDRLLSLRDVHIDIAQGDVVGIIGKNGAGKSTFLKILSRVTAPTKGSVKIRGRVASLLEVGTGFHPELTGRENMYLNGAILGMRKNEIDRKFDEIVDFSGVERFIDTPVKRYSSGMYVRLAFAVAAHLSSEILVVDEVLAVGDVEFQKKCLGKMGNISSEEGRTVLFVSHNLTAIKKLSKSILFFKDGQCEPIADVGKGIAAYIESVSQKTTQKGAGRAFVADFPRSSACTLKAKIVQLERVPLSDEDGQSVLSYRISIESRIDISVDLFARISDEHSSISFLSCQLGNGKAIILKEGINELLIKVDASSLYSGQYYLGLGLSIAYYELIDELVQVAQFEIESCDPNHTGYNFVKSADVGSVYIPWEVIPMR